ncbi:MAG: ComF family protein [Elusimicrobia bacterium]|nr:ComF family protein [Elusimicrobiota bacterium]
MIWLPSLWSEKLLHLLLPRTCAACARDLPFPLEGPLCGGCMQGLEPLRPPWCPRCGGPSNLRGPCPQCPRLDPGVPVARAAFKYRGPLPPLLHAFKYRGRLDAGRTLGDWMAGAWRRHPELGRPDALVPVPLHPARLRSRGFNQARVLAERLAPAARTPVRDLAVRVVDTPPQARRARAERGGRLAGAFKAAPWARGLRLVLIDDAMTSGETLAACAGALWEAGAADVKAFVLTRA